MVAAYASLSSGLSAYHWQMAVYLAWFANLTHLSGLTFLRKYLSHHCRERNWRISLMFLLFVMLVVGEVPTAFFNWSHTYDSFELVKEYLTTGVRPHDLLKGEVVIEVTAANASSYAWCSFNVIEATRQYNERWTNLKETPGDILQWVVDSEDVAGLEESTAFQSAVVSIVLLAFGFAARVVKLSKGLVTLVKRRLRPFCSRLSHCAITGGHKALLDRARKRQTEPADEKTHLRILYLYTKPVLALRFLVRIFADYYGSMASEVGSCIQ